MEVEKEVGGETSNRGGSKFGPWIHVQKKNRRQSSGKGIGRQSKTEDNTSKNKEETRFSVLNELTEDPEEELRIDSGNIEHCLTGDKTKEAQQHIGRNKGIEKGKKDHAKIRGYESYNKKIGRPNRAEGSGSKERTCNQNRGREENGSPEANEVFLQDLRKATEMVGVIDKEKGGQREENLVGNYQFAWSYPKRPPYSPRKVVWKNKSQVDTSSKRACPPSVEELVAKSV